MNRLIDHLDSLPREVIGYTQIGHRAPPLMAKQSSATNACLTTGEPVSTCAFTPSDQQLFGRRTSFVVYDWIMAKRTTELEKLKAAARKFRTDSQSISAILDGIEDVTQFQNLSKMDREAIRRYAKLLRLAHI